MKTIRSLLLIVLGGFALLSICAFQANLPPAQTDLTPTPTYDPLVEPPLPEHPTELELGKNLYWHWCMPCHGDVGQGLTDEFRGVWEPDHQNCWARGCHTGRKEDTGFPIPTVVPAIVIADKLAQFPSLQALADFLQATHPPQHPGILQADEYHAIAAYVFTMNDRPLEDSAPTPLPTSTVSLPPSNQGTSAPISAPFLVVGGAILFFTILFSILAMRRLNREANPPHG